MPNEEGLANAHIAIIDFYRKSGYQDSDEGICHGTSIRWMEAVCLGQEQKFLDRINKIRQHGDSLIAEIEQVKAKKGRNLTEEDKELLDIVGFFESLTLYHSPEENKSLFDVPLTQSHMEAISHYAASDEMEKRGGLKCVHSEAVIKNPGELVDYFDALGALIDKYDSNEPVGFILGSNEHTIALSYLPRVGWRAMDINQFPPVTYGSLETKQLVNYLRAGFPQSTDNPDYVFSVDALVPANDARLQNEKTHGLADAFKEFKQQHVLTEEMLNRKGIDNYVTVVVGQGDVDAIVALSDRGVNLEAKNEHGATPLYIAAQYGYHEIMDALASRGASVNAQNNLGFSPAFIAAHFGQTKALESLIHHGADLELSDAAGRTPVWGAAYNGHADIIYALAERNVDLNRPDGASGDTPIEIAMDNRHTEAVIALAKCGATIAPTAALSMAYEGYCEMIPVLASVGVDLNWPDERGFTPATIAARMGHADLLITLANNGIDLNLPDQRGITPVRIAAETGNAAVLNALASNGVDLNQPDERGLTLATIVAQKGHVAALEALASNGVDLNLPDQRGITPALAAIQSGQIDALVFLLKTDVVSLSHLDVEGRTLASIIESDHPEMLEQLVKNGIDKSEVYKNQIDRIRKILSEIKQYSVSPDDNEMRNFISGQERTLWHTDTLEAYKKLESNLSDILEQQKVVGTVKELTQELRVQKGVASLGAKEKAARIEKVVCDIPVEKRGQLRDDKAPVAREFYQEIARHRLFPSLRGDQDEAIDEKKAAKSFTNFKNKMREIKRDAPEETSQMKPS